MAFIPDRTWGRPLRVALVAGLVAGLAACVGSPTTPPTVAGTSHASTPVNPAGAATPAAGAISASLAGWERVRLPGKRMTAYERDIKDGQRCWMADSEQSASMYRKRLHLPPEQIGQLEFSWWVDALVPGADLSVSGLGDAPARLVLAFDGDHARLSLRNRMLFDLADSLAGERLPYATLMYVWANDSAADAVILNPRTDRIRKIVLESGPVHLRQWRHYQRDVAADFRRAFGEEPGPLIGLAMMTDTDNTGSSARTWYGDIHLRSPAPGPLSAASANAGAGAGAGSVAVRR